MLVEGDEALEDIAQFVGRSRPATTAGYVSGSAAGADPGDAFRRTVERYGWALGPTSSPNDGPHPGG